MMCMCVSWMFQECFKHILRKLQEFIKSASNVLKRKFQKCSQEVIMLFQESAMNVSGVFQRPIHEVSKVFKGVVIFLYIHVNQDLTSQNKNW